jgi:beta-glucosidase
MYRPSLALGILAAISAIGIGELSSPELTAATAAQPKIEARVAPILRAGGLTFKDLNKNGVLDPYEDWRLPIDQRVEDLVSKMTVEEKAALMFHASIQGATGPNGEVLETMGSFGGRGRAGVPDVQPTGVARAIRGRTNPYNVEAVDSVPVSELILKRGIRWAVIRPGNEAPEVTAKFVNNLQQLAEGSRLGIPMVPSDNPRTGIRRSVMGVDMASQAGRPPAATWRFNPASRVPLMPSRNGRASLASPPSVTSKP